MRTREAIEIPIGDGFNFESQGQRAILEVLLDIRDLLANPPVPHPIMNEKELRVHDPKNRLESIP